MADRTAQLEVQDATVAGPARATLEIRRLDVGDTTRPVEVRDAPPPAAEQKHRRVVAAHVERGLVDLPALSAGVEHDEERRRREDGVQLHEVAVSERSLAFRPDRENTAVVEERPALDHVPHHSRGIGLAHRRERWHPADPFLPGPPSDACIHASLVPAGGIGRPDERLDDPWSSGTVSSPVGVAQVGATPGVGRKLAVHVRRGKEDERLDERHPDLAARLLAAQEAREALGLLVRELQRAVERDRPALAVRLAIGQPLADELQRLQLPGELGAGDLLPAL